MDERLVIKKVKTTKNGRVVKPPKKVLTTSSDDDTATRRRSSEKMTISDKIKLLKQKIMHKTEVKTKPIHVDGETGSSKKSSAPCSLTPCPSIPRPPILGMSRKLDVSIPKFEYVIL